MDSQKRTEILHDIKKIALLIGEWEEDDRKRRNKIIMAFDKLYKDMEEMLK